MSTMNTIKSINMPTRMSIIVTPKHITTSSTVRISHIPLNSSQKGCFLGNFFHLVEHNLTLLLTFLISTTFSHSSSFTITPTPPTSCPFTDHHNFYLFPSILETCSVKLTPCKQHMSIILFLGSF